ncbi:MAG: AAA family ATPase [Leptolyngbyaceae cyanobacterium]
MKIAAESARVAGYQLVEQVYSGSRTLIYRAIREVDQCPVVMKLLQREYPTFNELLQFRNQYLIAKRLEIPGVIRPYSLEPYRNGHALIMEDMGGISLRDYLKTRSLSLRQFLQIAISLAEILHGVHQQRIIHKDIKPANILIHPETQDIKLIDFSIASLLPRETQEIQNPEGLEGTLAYMSPEQTGRMNRGLDYRTDFYSLGVTFYELLTGQLPFQTTDPMEAIHCHIARPPMPVHEVNPQVPIALSAIVAKLMAKNAEDRYQSALGLKQDLEFCLSQLETTGSIPPFPLGQWDLCDRFVIPEKLYGRQIEVATLLDSFAQVNQGHSQLVLVAGFSGIGKTAVVNEVHKPIVRQRGYFIKGKFDQFNRNIPFSAFVQALRDLMGQLLTESDTHLEYWKTAILQALGDNGQVILEVIPELEAIIGPQPAVPELSGMEAQNRFHNLFQAFIQVFATADHPLVMFLDDLQWADLASLNLMQLLTQQPDRGSLLLLGAYRDNEVSATHPLMLMVEKLRKADIPIRLLPLPPLSQTDINDLIADTLNVSPEVALPLTQLVYQKTQGNPFFATQLLKSLYADGWIVFNQETRQWQCDINQIKSLVLSDDVVEFMTLQLQKLPPQSQEILQLAACIGNQFDLATLATVCEKPSLAVAAELWTALQEGFILPQNEVYKFFQATEAEELTIAADLEGSQMSSSGSQLLSYRFLHDRIQQAAYSLIADDQKQATHLRIGKLLLRHTSAKEREERLFEIVNHLNRGSSLITQPQEQEKLAHLNLLAGRKAKAATAYSAAIEYLTAGIHLLPATAWDSEYALTLALYTELTEAAYLSTDYDQMEQWASLVLQHAKTLLDTIKTHQIRMMAAKSQGRLLDSLQIGLQVLPLLGVEFPDQPTQEDIGQAFAVTRQLWQDREPLSLLDLPAMTDAYSLAVMDLITVMIPSAYMAAPDLMPLLIFKQVELSIRYGNCPVSVFAYSDYGLMLCGVIGDIPSGYEFGQLALQPLETLQVNAFKSRAWFVVHTFIKHWKAPLREIVPRLQEAYQSGLETGDLECVALNASAYCFSAYYSGQELTGLAEEMDAYRQTIRQFKQFAPLDYQEIYQQAVLNLLGQSETPDRLVGSVFNEEAALPVLQAANHRTTLFYLHLNQTMLAYLFGQYSRAAQTSTQAAQYLDGAIATFMIPLHCFYDCLVYLALYEDSPLEEQQRILQRVEAQQEQLRRWADLAPCNHEHRWALVEAERHRVLGERLAAMEQYDRAIASAKANHFIQDEALANELAGRFYLSWNKERFAQGYLTEAYYGYARWGAAAKAIDLELHYPQLLAPVLKQAETTLNTQETLMFSNRTVPSSHGTSSSSSVSTTLDLLSVLKVSQVLSQEIELDNLLTTLLQVLIENAGADKGVLILQKDNQSFVEAVMHIGQSSAGLQSTPLEESRDVPLTLISMVKRNLQPTVIMDGGLHPSLARDIYILKQMPKSLLCTPILHQGKLLGMLYLENSLVTGAFTHDRVELLNLLCTQAAISLENARLYQQAQQALLDLQQAQLQLVQSEKMSALGNLVAGVAHEINNPVGFLAGNLTPAQEYVSDLLGLIDLYQQEYPTSTRVIQNAIEVIDLDYLREDLPKLLNSIKLGVERIRSISQSLRTFSRADKDYKVPFDIHEGLDSTLLILKHRLKASDGHPAIDVVKHYGQLPLIHCFPGQLNQVFMNILANAIDALEETNAGRSFAEIEGNSNRITIATQVLDENWIAIQIADNGIGMTEEVKCRIFDHLFTTKAVGKGTGLGMAIAHQIVVEKHAGTIEVNSMPGQGTEMVIKLPIKAS